MIKDDTNSSEHPSPSLDMSQQTQVCLASYVVTLSCSKYLAISFQTEVVFHSLARIVKQREGLYRIINVYESIAYDRDMVIL